MGRTHEQRKLASQGKRKCRMCNKIKTTINSFHIKRHYYDDNGQRKYSSYDSRCKACMKDYTRSCITKSTEAYCKHLTNQLRHRAKKANISFNLITQDLIDTWNKQNGKCYYSGVTLDLSLQTQSRNSPHRLFPSLDRQIPQLGYVKNNIIWCTYVVNRMKSDLSHKEFVDFCNLVTGTFKKSR